MVVGATPGARRWGVHYVWFGLGLLALSLVTIALAAAGGTGLGWRPLWALVRASVQLAVVALLLHGVLSYPATVAAFLLLMLATASWTSAGRLSELRNGRRIAVVGVAAGAVPAVAAVFVLQLVDLDARYLVAVGGIVVGNAMSAATLAGRNFSRSARARAPEVEGWFALGATAPVAHLDIGREAMRESLLPNQDQTRATGLVTLPGAFVGALFGGASPVQAAEFQLVVLASIALAMTTTALVVTRLAGRTPYVASASLD